MKLFDNSIVRPKELSIFLNCHEKTAKKYYVRILEFVNKPPYGLLVLEDLSLYYQVPLEDLKAFTYTSLN
ncbi:hypothetical protein [Polaribacter sp.]|uniref:hypothetical protein n=1 Tax=Polaribacter sp. TaxID=1920175 RepID=UPI004048DC53